MFKKNKIVIPTQAGIQTTPEKLDSCFHRNGRLMLLYLKLVFFSFVFVLSHPGLALPQIDPATAWHLLYLKIRDQLILKAEAQKRLKSLEILLKGSYPKKDLQQKDRLCFPLRGYGPSAIGGKEGSGYQLSGYDFFDGNQHKGHPGHDIFIRDKNQDCIDDETGKPVDVLAAAPGIVVSINTNWEPSSPIRGGHYIWVFEPTRSRYYYYAHLNEIFIKTGQLASKGEKLGTVGRTGLKAYPKRSPTHLHFTVLESKDSYPRPINPFKELVQSETSGLFLKTLPQKTLDSSEIK